MSRALIAQRLELGQALGRLAAALGEADLQLGERILQVGIGQRGVDIVLEVVGGRFHQPSLARSRRLADRRQCRPCRPAPRRHGAPAPGCPRAAACPPCSSGSRGRPPAACRRRRPAMSADFSPTMALEISGYFTQKVPPKPQQTSGDVHLAQAEALHRAEQLARLVLDAELAQARAGIVIGDDAVVARRDLGARPARRPGTPSARSCGRPGSRPAPSSPGRRRTGPDSDGSACRRRSPRGRPRRRSLRRPR